MKCERASIFVAIFILLASTLACGLFSGEVEIMATPVITDQIGKGVSTNEPAEEQTTKESPLDQSDSHPQSQLNLGDEYLSKEGGYAFKPIADYEFEEFFGLATMIAPDADQDLGPMLMLIGGLNEEEVTGEKIFNDFMEDAESEDVEILDQTEIFVDGKSGLLAEIVWRCGWGTGNWKNSCGGSNPHPAVHYVCIRPAGSMG